MRVGRTSFQAAEAEHARLSSRLRALGAELIELAFVHGAFDSVFVKDVALFFERGGMRYALLANFRHEERAPEVPARARYLASLGFEVIPPPPAWWEGGDVVVAPGGGALLLGYGPRSEAAAAAWLEKSTGLPVVPLELARSDLYHLDTALAALPTGAVILCKQAFRRDPARDLLRLPGVTEVVAIEHDDHLAFGLNCVVIGQHVILGACEPRVEAAISAAGLSPVVAPLTQFHLAGGSAACLVAELHRF